MPLNEVAKQKCLRGLTCAYTGKPVTVRVIAADGCAPLFFSPDAFDPSVPVKSLKELLELAGTRNGVSGAAQGQAAMVCPYTGVPMAVQQTDEGYSLVGGFSPANPEMGADIFAYQMRMRNGVSEGARPVPARIEAVPPAPPPQAPVRSTPKDSSLEHAERALAPNLPKATGTVQVPGGVPRKRVKPRE